MKRLLLAFVLALILVAGITLLTRQFGAGYVVLSFADFSVETSFIFAVSVLALSFFVFYYGLRALAFIIRAPLYLRLRARHKRNEQARHSLIKGLLQLSEGRFAEAEKVLLKHARNADTTLLNYLLAARAAHQQAAYAKRDEYLKLAQAEEGENGMATGITQAELQMSHKQYDAALATLLQLDSRGTKNGYVKKLLAKTYEQLGDWTSLSNLLDELKKNRLLPENAFSDLEIYTYQGLMQQLSRQKNAQDVLTLWQRLPKHLKDNSHILQVYVEQLINQKQHNEAEALLRSHLNKNWNENLVLQYSQVLADKSLQQLETAEAWLPEHQRSAALLLTLGKLCLRNKLWGKARTYLEASLGARPMAETCLHLAMLLEEKMQEPAKAQQLYQQGLKLAVACETGQNQTPPPSKLAAVPLRVV